jgi:hypothetical protein
MYVGLVMPRRIFFLEDKGKLGCEFGLVYRKNDLERCLLQQMFSHLPICVTRMQADAIGQRR